MFSSSFPFRRLSCFLICLMTLLTLIGFSQVMTYNRNIIFTTENADELCNGVAGMNRYQYVVSQLSLDTAYTIGIACIDDAGAIVWKRQFDASRFNFLPGWNNCLNFTSDGHLILTGSQTDRYDTAHRYDPRTFLAKFDTNGNMVWLRIVNDTLFTDTDTQGATVIETSDRGFALIGQIGIMGILYRLDSLGRILWYRTFGAGQTTWYEYLHTVNELPDHGFIIGSYGFNGHLYQSGDPYLTRLDAAGNGKWRRSYGGEFPDGNPCTQLIDDSTLMLVVPHTTKAAWFGQQTEMKIKIVKVAVSGGQILAERKYGFPDRLYAPMHFQVISPGYMVACGDNMYLQMGWLLGFNDQCDSLFYREYPCPVRGPGIDTLRELNSMMVCPDGGILTVGTSYRVVGSEYRGNGWLLKTDRYGCLQAGCDPHGIYISTQPGSSTLCLNQQGVMTVTASAGNPEFRWQRFIDPAWVDLADNALFNRTATHNLEIFPKESDDTSMTLRARLFNPVYEMYSHPAVLTIADTAKMETDPEDQYLRINDPAFFRVAATGDGMLSYQWYRNFEVLAGQTDDTLQITAVRESDTGIYFCRVRNFCGDDYSMPAQLSVNHTATGSRSEEFSTLVYPDPFHDCFCIRKRWPAETRVTIRIIDLPGRIRYERAFCTGRDIPERVCAGRLEPGLYIVTLSTGKEFFRTRIVKY